MSMNKDVDLPREIPPVRAAFFATLSIKY
jgi:hypothetical protein